MTQPEQYFNDCKRKCTACSEANKKACSFLRDTTAQGNGFRGENNF